MDTSRIRQGEMIAAVAAIVLFIVMFLAWFSIPGADEETTDQARQSIEAAEEAGLDTGDAGEALDAVEDSASISAWDAFDFIKIVLILTIIAAIALAVISATATQVNLPVALSVVVAGLGILSTLLVLYRLIDPPAEGLDRSYGVFLGLIACAAIAYGGWRAMQEEGTSFQGEADRLQSDRGTGPGPGAGSPPPPPPPPPSSGPAA